MDALKIAHLHIEGFWNLYTIDLDFENDVNIFTGNNGAGKTTILDIVHSLLSGSPDNSYTKTKYRNAELTLTNQSKVSVHTSDTGEVSVEYCLSGRFVTVEEFRKLTRCMVVSNFDSSLPAVDVIAKYKEENHNILSELDIQLNGWIRIYNQYMSSVSRRVDILLSKGNSDTDNINQLFRYSRKMEEICNGLLEDNKKWHVSEEGKVQFEFTDTNKLLTPEQLSSGEKQLIILLISTMVQNGTEWIVFWDEPEISLHISWQQKLIRTLRTLNPNMQLIIATHSPNILYEGWEGKVVNVRKHFVHE